MMNGYRHIIETARKDGKATEAAMWQGIADVDELLESMKAEHPREYWRFMRRQHENLYGCHYNEDYAAHDVAMLEYTDANGKHHTGYHWRKDECVRAMQGRQLPAGTTECDIYVALNAAYADFCKKFTESEIIEIAYLFYFADEDYHGCGKIWQYMNINR